MSGVNAAQVQSQGVPFRGSAMAQERQANANDAGMVRGRMGGNDEMIARLLALLNQGGPGMQATVPDRGLGQIGGKRPRKGKGPKGDGGALLASGTGKPSVDVEPVKPSKGKDIGKVKPTITVDKEPAKKKSPKPKGKINRVMEY